MSKSSGSIGLLPLIIAVYAFYTVFLDDDDKKTDVKEETNVIIDDVKEGIPAIKKDLNKALDDAKKAFQDTKEAFKKVKIKKEKEEDIKVEPDPGPLVTKEEPSEEKLEPEKKDEPEQKEEPTGRAL